MIQLGYWVVQFAALFFATRYIEAGRQQHWPDRRIWTFAIVASICFAAWLLVVSDPPLKYVFADFQGSYYRTSVVLDDPQALAKVMGPAIHGFVNLPILAYLFAPLGALPFPWAIGIFSLIGVVVVAWSWRILVDAARLDSVGAALLLCLFAANGPLMYNFREGNISHITLFLLLLAFVAQRKNRLFTAGLILGFAALLKMPLLLFGIYYVLRRRWAAVAGGAVVCVTAGLLSLAVFGWDLHVFWYTECIKNYSLPMAGYNVQSIAAFLARWERGTGSQEFWIPQALGPVNGVILIILQIALYLTALFAAWTRDRKQPIQGNGLSAYDLEFMVVMLLACVTSPVAWTHYYLWLLMPIAFLINPATNILPEQRGARLVFWLFCLAAAMPVANHSKWEYFTVQRIFTHTGGSIYVFSALAILGLLIWRLGWKSDSRVTPGVAPHEPARVPLGTT